MADVDVAYFLLGE